MKKVCVPRLAVIEKYESRKEQRIAFCSFATYGVSQRINGMSVCRTAYCHAGSLFLSDRSELGD